MGDQGRWFKLWVSAPTDPHLRNLPLEDVGRWCLFGAFLKVHGRQGRLVVQFPGAALQDLFRVEAWDAVVSILKRFPNCMVKTVTNSPVTMEVEWHNWKKYQEDSSAERTRLWREKRDGAKKRRDEKRRDEKIKTKTVGTDAPRAVLPDDQFLAALRRNRAYSDLDLDQELAKMDAWLLTPRGRGKKKTRGRIVAWLNRALEDLPLEPGKQGEEPYGFER